MQGEEQIYEELIGAKVGTEFIIITKSNLKHIELDKDERQVLIYDVKYQLYKGKNFEDSREIELFTDEEGYKTYKINDYFIDLKDQELNREPITRNNVIKMWNNPFIITSAMEDILLIQMLIYELKDEYIIDTRQVRRLKFKSIRVV